MSNKNENIFTITVKDKFTKQELSRDYNLEGKMTDDLGENVRDMLDTVQIHYKRFPF